MKMIKQSQAAISVFFSLTLLAGLVSIARAEPEASGTLIPTDDAYTDISIPGIHPSIGTLDLAFSGDPVPQPSKIVFLKFDLSGINFTIQQARLNLAVITGCVVPSAVSVAVYGALDVYHNTTTPWVESGITWNNQPDRDPTAVSPLIYMDEGVVKLTGGYHHWTDTGAGDFADWLETQRIGDGIATLRLEIPPNPGTSEVWFEDAEGTATGFPTCVAIGGPVLQIADAAGPLSIELLDMHASPAAASRQGRWLALLAITIMGWGVYTLKKRSL